MSDFIPVELVKGDVSFTAQTPAQLVNALYGGGYRRKPVAAAAVEPAPVIEPAADADTEAEAPTGRRKRASTQPPEEVSA